MLLKSISRYLLIGFLFSLLPTQTVLAAEKIKIGVSVPLTGAAAAYGEDIKNALLFANKHLANSAYELIIEDDHCLDKEAVAVAHKLVDVNQVKYLLGFGCSGTVLAAAPVYNQAKAVLIASGTGAPKITNAGDYVFRTKPSLIIAADLLAKNMAEKFKKVGIITEETAFAQGLTDAVVKDAAELKFETVNENFISKTEDFRAILLKLKGAGVEALFINPQGEPEMITIFKQFQQLNWKIPVYGVFLPGSASFLQAFGKEADGLIYADLPFNEDMLNAKGLELWKEFEKEYGHVKSADHYAALTFASFSAMHQALQSEQDGGVKEYLYKNTFGEVIDKFSFDKNGDVVSEKLTYVLKRVINGAPARY
jgi:branched-chain amino acid transport system substrate-binding protein